MVAFLGKDSRNWIARTFVPHVIDAQDVIRARLVTYGEAKDALESSTDRVVLTRAALRLTGGDRVGSEVLAELASLRNRSFWRRLCCL